MWYTKDLETITKELRSNVERGLNEEEVHRRIEKYGKNRLKEKKKESMFVRFIKQFNDFMIIILIIASIVSAVIAYVEGSGDYIDSIIIIAIVIFNAIMGLVQETKAEKSLEALKKLSAPISKVRRSGKVVEVDSSEVVPGDIVILEAGNYVPADCRIIKSSDLKIEESSLTGENAPVTKNEGVILKEKVALRRYGKYGICNFYSSKWSWRSYCYRNRYEYNGWKNSQYDYRGRVT